MKRVTVWHEGDCSLCWREITLMRRLDTRGAIEFVDATGSVSCPLDRDPSTYGNLAAMLAGSPADRKRPVYGHVGTRGDSYTRRREALDV